MIFNTKNALLKEGRYIFKGEVKALANICFGEAVFGEFWNNFCFGLSKLLLSEVEHFAFYTDGAKLLPTEGHSYAILVDENGFSVNAEDKNGLLLGFMTLLDRIKLEEIDGDSYLVIDAFELRETPLVPHRMVHFCVFPETEIWEVRRFLRFAAALKYSHVVLEFWGTLRYDVMRELSWSTAFEKDDIRPIIEEARALGLEIVPMFNHWGHAAASRVRHGKHVVLDQNPSLQSYFSEDGWCWDLSKEKVRALLSSIRRELIELCGEGEFFHIGCDEAYNFDISNKDSVDLVAGFINSVSEDMKKRGRRIIVWGDMFISKRADYNPENKYDCNAPNEECAEYIRCRIDRDIIIADWQYNVEHAPVETALTFKNAGFDCMLCPWDRSAKNVNACLTTLKENDLFGLIHTTWHTLSTGMYFVTVAAVGCFGENVARPHGTLLTKTASLMRKVSPANGEYRKAGWAKKQIDDFV